MVYGIGACFNSMKDLCKVLKNDPMTHSSPMSTITSRPEYLGVRFYSKRDFPEVRNISTSAMRLQATEVLSTVPNVRPSSLVNLARLKHGVACSYSSAWRAMQCHRQDISKADVISFGQIPYFLHGIEIANPGSTTYVAATSEGIFDNAFFCLGPMGNAVQSMSTNADYRCLPHQKQIWRCYHGS
ncbi:hypothetical protein BASA83_008315 [Batrachochytrium salamandrivorans]|nr:hypothetical protein BASA83_008315 [Batrachochytrium salamandrivorans]